MEDQELEPDEQSPIVYEDMPYFTCELTSLNRIAFSVADDPFYKPNRGKYYPEAVLINSKGKILTKIGPHHHKQEKYGMEYVDDIREP